MMNVPGFQDSLWTNGPSAESFYNFPGNQNKSKIAEDFSPIKRTQYPMTTGTSVLGLKYDGGVLLAADTLGSYGSLARFREVSRLMAVGNNTVVGGSGDYADFQYIQSLLEQKVIDDACFNDGHGYTPKSIYSWLTRKMYHRRSKFNPLWNQIVVGGVKDGESFLGCVDKIGVAFEAPTVATGFGAYLAQPILRDALEKNGSMSLDKARQVVISCLRVLFYRDARSLNKYELAVVTNDGATIEPVESLGANWEIAPMVNEDERAADSDGHAWTQIEPNKIYLYRLYGNNNRSQKKFQVEYKLREGKSVAVIASELGITKDNAERYAIDCFVDNAPLDKTMLARHVKVNPNSFKLIKGAIEGCKDGKLRTVRDHLDDVFSYNQIRLVLACMIHNLEID